MPHFRHGKLADPIRLRSLYSTSVYARDYDGAVKALNALQSNYSAVQAVRSRGQLWNEHILPEMTRYVQRIGYEPFHFDQLNPIHVAGTKGKGSTCAFVSSILAQYLPSGQSIHAERLPSNVGLYTSPHLRFVRERIQINNQPISGQQFAQYFWDVWDGLEASRLTDDPQHARGASDKPVYFHFLTLVALHCFMKEKVGTAIIECGIGGEYDTTNILVAPSVTGVTSLGIDHQVLLGDTIESIAWHKAGIFKKGAPAFTVPQAPNAMRVLRERAAEKGVDLAVIEEYKTLAGVKLGLAGDVQRTNASLAIALCSAHLSRLSYAGLPDPMDTHSSLPPKFIQGLETARLGGRFDKRTDAMHPNLTWFIDGSHTLESIGTAARWFASSQNPALNSTRVLIFNQQTRDASALARHLHATLARGLNNDHPFIHAIFCSNMTYKDAGYKPDLVSINANQEDLTSLRIQRELASTWNGLDATAVSHVVSTIEEAVRKARKLAGGNRTEVLVTGSLHLVGGLIEVLESEMEKSRGDARQIQS